MKISIAALADIWNLRLKSDALWDESTKFSTSTYKYKFVKISWF